MNYSPTSSNSMRRFWSRFGSVLPWNRYSLLGIAVVATVAVAVILTYILAGAGDGDSFSTRSSSGFDGESAVSASPPELQADSVAEAPWA